MSVQRTSVGLDVHARSVVASALDGVTGEVIERRLTSAHADVAAWVGSLPGLVAVVYEAGPTGFGLARFLTAVGMRCEVAAPSKLQRPAGDRVKTDARDARHLARLLHLGQVVAVAVPDAATEAARDLVRAREDVRGDLMSARHRVSKLLLRQGIVYAGGKAWTGVHDTWLRAQRRGRWDRLGGERGLHDQPRPPTRDHPAPGHRGRCRITRVCAPSPLTTRSGAPGAG